MPVAAPPAEAAPKQWHPRLVWLLATAVLATAACYGLYAFQWDPPGSTAARWTIWLIAAVPLLAPLPALLRRRRSVPFLYAILALPYFAHGSMRLLEPETRWQGIIIMLGSGVVFVLGFALARLNAPPPAR